jgi:hypothetical protein
MSLATTMPHHFSFDPAPTSFDPFGSNPDVAMPVGPFYDQGIIAPQGRVPVTSSSLVPPQAASRPVSRPDFTRGFGLDIPEEAEEEAEEHAQDQVAHEGGNADISQDMDLDEVEEREMSLDGIATASQSRFHSRHVSKLSAALSIRSAGALEEDAFDEEDELTAATVDADYRAGQEDMDLEDAIGEWTGSEDVYETSDGEEV